MRLDYHFVLRWVNHNFILALRTLIQQISFKIGILGRALNPDYNFAGLAIFCWSLLVCLVFAGLFGLCWSGWSFPVSFWSPSWSWQVLPVHAGPCRSCWSLSVFPGLASLDVKGMDVTQPIWLTVCLNKCNFINSVCFKIAVMRPAVQS